jgi:hypothetical protein
MVVKITVWSESSFVRWSTGREQRVIEVAAVDYVENDGVDRNVVEDIHIVQFAVGNANNGACQHL